MRLYVDSAIYEIVRTICNTTVN